MIRFFGLISILYFFIFISCERSETFDIKSQENISKIKNHWNRSNNSKKEDLQKASNSHKNLPSEFHSILGKYEESNHDDLYANLKVFHAEDELYAQIAYQADGMWDYYDMGQMQFVDSINGVYTFQIETTYGLEYEFNFTLLDHKIVELTLLDFTTGGELLVFVQEPKKKKNT